MKVDKNELYGVLYRKGAGRCCGLRRRNGIYYYFSENRSLVWMPAVYGGTDTRCRFTLANFMRSHLYSAVATLKISMDILLKEEHVAVDSLMGHGGFFKTPVEWDSVSWQQA